MRLVVTFLLVLLFIAARADAAEVAPEPRDPKLFASDVVALHAAGWSFGDVVTQTDRERTLTLAVVLVDAGRVRAQRFGLEVSDDGQTLVRVRLRFAKGKDHVIDTSGMEGIDDCGE